MTSNTVKIAAATGAIDPTWQPAVAGMISALAVSGNSLFIGGIFNSVGGQARDGLAKVSTLSAGSVDATWYPSPSSPSQGNHIRSLAVSGSSLFVGGIFFDYSGATYLAKISTSGVGTVDQTWTPQPAGYPNNISIDGTDVFVAGSCVEIGGYRRNNLFRFVTATGDTDPTWNPNVDGTVYALAVGGNNLFAGGFFNNIGTQGVSNLAKISTTGVGIANATWIPNPNGLIRDIATNGTDVFVGGNYTSIGGQARAGLAKVSAAGGGTVNTLWNPAPNGLTNPGFPTTYGRFKFILNGSNLFVAGESVFAATIGGQPCVGITKLSTTGAGNADPSWAVNFYAGYAQSVVYDMASNGTDLFAIGNFYATTDALTNSNGHLQFGTAKISMATGLIDPAWIWEGTEGFTPQALAISGNDLYFVVGGGHGIKKVSGAAPGVEDPSWYASPYIANIPLYSRMSVSGNKLFVGGEFMAGNNTPAPLAYSKRSLMVFGITTSTVAPTAFTAQTPTSGTVSNPYSYTFVANGTPTPTYAVLSGTLPPGLTLAPNGVLSGTPTTAGTFGPIVVRATNAGGSVDTAPFSITIYPAVAVPTITCTAIASTGGNVVVINGTNFTGATAVTFGGVNASSFTVNSSTQISATVNWGSTNGSYAVTTPGGSASCAMFTYQPTPPIITSINPAFGVSPAAVTLSGSNFLGTTQVTFGGVPATIVSVTNSKIVVTLGVGTVASTPLVVAATKADGTATLTGFVYSNVPPIPNVTAFTPLCGTTGTVVTINGTGFSGAKSVRFGGTPAAFVIDSDTQVRATVGSGSTGAVTVTSLSGTNSFGTFTYNPLPTISAFSPNDPDPNTVMTITGTNFTGGCGATVQNLYLGGQLIPPANYTVVSPTQISVTVPPTASTGTIQIIRTDNSNATRTGFLFNAPRPISFTPISGTIGTAVVITGSNFSGTSGAGGVRINGVNAASYTVDSDTQITAYPAASTGLSGTITVTNSKGNGSAGTFTFTPPPIVDGFYASYGSTGATVTLYGRHFTGAFQVKFGGTLGTITSVSAGQIVAEVGAGASGAVSVTTPGGVGSRNAFRFATTPLAAPTITTVTPQPVSQQDGTLTINGTNLNTATAVLLNGVPLRFVGTPTATQVQVTVPVGSVSGNIVVYTHGGTVTNAVTVLPLPTLTSFTPTTGPTGTVVTITGSGFLGTSGAANVRFGATNASSYTVVNDNTITATVAAGATGLVRVVTPGGTVFSATNFTYVPPTPAPTITGFTPDIAATGTLVTITGTNFTGATQVRFGGTNAASYTVVNATTITATVAAGATGNVSVVTPGGTATFATYPFTYLTSPLPSITSFTPVSGPVGTVITVTGQNLTGTTRMTIGGALVTAFTVNSNTQITATVPAGAITGKVVVFKEAVVPVQSAQSATDFTVVTTLLFAKNPSENGALIQSSLTSVESTTFANGVTVYPNPTVETLTVQVPVETSAARSSSIRSVRIVVMNLLGERLANITEPVRSDATMMSTTIDVHALPSGTYLLEVHNGSTRSIARFVKN
jgi:IPT/TIG domain/Secretion system C-terminal sorting domain